MNVAHKLSDIDETLIGNVGSTVKYGINSSYLIEGLTKVLKICKDILKCFKIKFNLKNIKTISLNK